MGTNQKATMYCHATDETYSEIQRGLPGKLRVKRVCSQPNDRMQWQNIVRINHSNTEAMESATMESYISDVI